ncbi:Crp/Fnr family transcriptional regulator [Desulfogranum japonicum]|uniref:Crp/Fnr family transcriptional regulator n=1 Tax=Desulfogranum japonicum TaxID=231447 RepID=UPI0004070C28|nr:Crp/Fnr family transcriptional regulator [Desulfogranum japonicum]
MRFLQENLLDLLQSPGFENLRSSFVSRSYVKDSYICQPDSRENSIFIVQSGRARVYLGYEEKEFNLAILTSGDIYSTHTGTYVQALSPLEVLVTDVATFHQQMASYREVNQAMIKVLGNILQASFKTIDSLVFQDTSCRLLSLLLTEAKRRTTGADGSVLLDINLSVEQIANLVGASRQTVSTQLNRLIKAGCIQRQTRGTFMVPDVDALEREYHSNGCP